MAADASAITYLPYFSSCYARISYIRRQRDTAAENIGVDTIDSWQR
jgi:hypothetical protein